MKKTFRYLQFICITIFLIACDAQKTSAPENKALSRNISDSYEAPLFINDVRKEKIKELAPKIHQLMVDHAKTRKIPGIAYGIVVDNELVLSDATGLMNIEAKVPATTRTSFRIASMTKSFTAMAIMKLRDEGKLSLHDPVSQYIPEMANLTYLTHDSPVIDIENLLTMTAGFPEDNPWGDRQLDEPTQMLLDLVKEGIAFSNTPSYQYEYSNTGYALLGNIITRVSGEPFQTYIKTNVLQPLGMNQTYWEIDNVPAEQLAIGYRWEDDKWKLEPMLHDGSYGAMGGLITSIEDFSKYVSFLLSAWPPRSNEDTGPIKRSSLREMQTPQFPRLNTNSTDFKGEPCATMGGYGFGLGITTYCNDLVHVGHGGALPGFGSNYRFFPEYGVGVMAFCNLTYTTPYPFAEIGKLLFETADLQPRKLPVSTVLNERKTQIVDLIQSWDAGLEAKILAENFYLDKSRAHRIAEIKGLLDKAGAIQTVGDIDPRNQLRGSFDIQAENDTITVFFTLSPEKYPKVQKLEMYANN